MSGSNKFEIGDSLNFYYIQPRSITSISRIFLGNEEYKNAGPPIGVQVGFVNGNGTWSLFRKISVEPTKDFPISGRFKLVETHTGKWR